MAGETHDALLDFLYRAPVALLQTDAGGRVLAMTPRAVQLLLPLAPGGALDNLFEIVAEAAPDLRAEVAAFVPPRGCICEGRRLRLSARGGAARETVLSLGITKLDAGRLAAWFADVTGDEAQRLAVAEHLALATEAAGIGTFEYREQGPLHWNARTFALFGEPDGEDARAVIGRAVSPLEVQRLAAWVKPLRDGQEGGIVEFEIRLPDGQPRWLAAKGRRSRDADGQPGAVVGVVWDVTEQHRAVAAIEAQRVAERASRAKTEFLSRLGHEIRTPLNAILGFAQMLLRDDGEPLGARQRQQMTHIGEAGRHLERLITDLTDLSLIEAGAVRLDSSVVDAAAVAAEVLDEAAPMAQAGDVALRRRLPDRPALTVADRTRLRQVLANLVSNAVKYNRPGGDVEVSVASADEGWRIAVRDTGIGMSAEQALRLFQPFDRLGRERSGVPGTGIGLVLTRELVEAMGGALEVWSEDGRGSVFAFTLPAAAAPTDAPPAPSALVRRPEVRGHVLAVEDDPVNAVLLHGVFAWRPGVTLEIAATGAAALAAARRRTPDLLLLDLQLPDRPGLDLLHELRERDGLTVPCIVVSGTTSRDADAARAGGAQAFLEKPLDVATLLATVDALLPSD